MDATAWPLKINIFRTDLISFLFIFGFFFTSLIYAQENYKWTDEKGNIHFSDSITGIPQRYLNQVQREKIKKEEEISPETSLEEIIVDNDEEDQEETKDKGLLHSFEISYESRERSRGKMFIKVTFNDKMEASMLVDTGAEITVISLSLADRIGLFEEGRKGLTSNLYGLASVAVPTFTALVDKIQIGEAEERFVPVRILLRPLFHMDGIIGMDLMSKYSITIDSKRNVLEFIENDTDLFSPGGKTEKLWRRIFGELATQRREWKIYVKNIESKIEESPFDSGPEIDNLNTVKLWAEGQLKEATRQLDDLEYYASQNSVPRIWRDY